MPAFTAVLARLFTIQAAWNYERMQGVGFGFAADPALRQLDGGDGTPRYREALARQSRFFNAHPYFAGLAIGAAVRAEHDGEPPEKIARLREALCGPLGSIGDRLFWAAWLPICSALGIVAFAFGAAEWSALLFLAAWNVAHVWCRVWALRAGWAAGMQVAGALSTPVLRLMTRAATPAAALVVGAAIPIAVAWQLAGASPRVRLFGLAGVAFVALLLFLVRRRLSGIAVAALLLGGAWLVGLVR